MCRKFVCVFSIIIIFCLTSPTFGIVIGDYENNMDGWAPWPVPDPLPPGTVTSYSLIGVTLNSNSLKVEVPLGGWQAALYIPLHTKGLVADFLASNTVSMDVTYDPADWAGAGNWANFELVINSKEGGWIQLGRPRTDSVNASYTSGWDPVNYPNAQTRTVTWNYSSIVGSIPADTEWLEIVFVTNYDEAFTKGVYYIDNVKLTYELPGTVLGNWENGSYDSWIDWGQSQATIESIGAPKYTFSATGATLGSSALKVSPESGWQQNLSISLGNIGMLDAFMTHSMFAIDVTYNSADWDPTVSYAGIYALSLNADGFGWNDVGGASAPSGANGVVFTDTLNPASPGAIPLVNPGTPGTILTGTWTWDYSGILNSITNPPTYVEFIIATNSDVAGAYYFDNARLLGNGTLGAHIPYPANGATDTQINPILAWTSGTYAATHDVYFGTDETKVTDANSTSHPDVQFNNVGSNKSDPGILQTNTTYYWRVDEVNDAHLDKLWTGATWSFTTGTHISVDDMESYGDANTPGPPPPPGSRIWYTWKDGVGWTKPSVVKGNGTGSIVDPNGGVVHGGTQSLKLWYDNSGKGAGLKYYSEIKADTSYLAIGRDWTKHGAKSLTLWFYGDPYNAISTTEQMYVKLNGAKVVYDGDATDVNEASWHEWKIDLAKFAQLGVTLSDVNDIAIGFGDETNTTKQGGSGFVYFDDIRLYPPRCILSKRTGDFAKIDYAPVGSPGGDCLIDYGELQMMVNDWLIKDGDFIATTNPSTAGLVAYYPFNEGTGTTTADASGNSHDGTFSGGVSWVSPGVMDGKAINVDGGDSNPSRITIGTWNPTAGTDKLTLAIWAKWAGQKATTRPQGLIGKRGGWSSSTVMFMFEVNTNGNSGGIAFRQYSAAVYSPDNIMIPFIGQWAHLAATFDGTTAIIYLNGREVASGAYSFGGGTTADITIGNTCSSGSGYSEAFNGNLDEAYIFNRALSPAEIAYLADTTPEDGQIYTPVPSKAELYDAEPKGSRAINLNDFAVLADYWLEEQMWP